MSDAARCPFAVDRDGKGGEGTLGHETTPVANTARLNNAAAPTPIDIDLLETGNSAPRTRGQRIVPLGATERRRRAYPPHVVGRRRTASGTTLDIRPVAPADAELIRHFVRSLSFETRYMRFMSGVKELSAQTAELLTSIDHRQDAALLAVAKEGGADRVVGVVRYALCADGDACEFAIVVADDWQRSGLGHLLMTLLLDTAEARGVKRIVGDVLAINRPMLAFVKAVGFRIGPSSHEPAILRVERSFDDGRRHA